MTATRVLVTGGAGFVGSHLTDSLVAEGFDVTVLDSLDPQAHEGGVSRYLSPHARLVQGDLRDRDALGRALDGAEYVFHQAGMVGNGQSMYDMARYIDVNATGTAILMEEVIQRRERVRRVIAASSMVVYGDGAYRCAEHGAIRPPARNRERLAAHRWEPECPRCGTDVAAIPTREDHPLESTSPYGIGKRAGEELVLVAGSAHEVDCVALRYLNVYGPRQALGNPYTGMAAIFCARLLSGRPPLIFEDGEQRRDLVHVSDVVRANRLAMDAPVAGHAINVGTGASITVGELATILCVALAPHLSPEITGQYRAGDIRHCWADTSRAEQMLGFRAEMDRTRALTELAEWASGESPVDRSEEARAELVARGMIR